MMNYSIDFNIVIWNELKCYKSVNKLYLTWTNFKIATIRNTLLQTV